MILRTVFDNGFSVDSHLTFRTNVVQDKRFYDGRFVTDLFSVEIRAFGKMLHWHKNDGQAGKEVRRKNKAVRPRYLCRTGKNRAA